MLLSTHAALRLDLVLLSGLTIIIRLSIIRVLNDMKPWHWDDGRQRADWYKVGRCSLGVVLFIVCQSGVSLYVEINYVVVLNVLYQASVFGNIFCVLREGALRSLICWYLASGWRQGASLCQQANNTLLSSPASLCLIWIIYEEIIWNCPILH